MWIATITNKSIKWGDEDDANDVNADQDDVGDYNGDEDDSDDFVEIPCWAATQEARQRTRRLLANSGGAILRKKVVIIAFTFMLS